MRLKHPKGAHVVDVDPAAAGIYLSQGWVEVDQPTKRTPRRRRTKKTSTARASGKSGTAPRNTTTKEEA